MQDRLEIAVGSGNLDVPSAIGEATGVEGASGAATAAGGEVRVATSLADDSGTETPLAQEHEELTRIRNVQQIELGTFLVNTWYFSPFPQEVHTHTHCVNAIE